MQPAQRRNDPAQNVPPPQAAAAPTGIAAWLGKKILGTATAHETPETVAGRKIAPQLVDDIAVKITQAIVAKADSDFVAGGRENIKETLSDLIAQIVQKLSTMNVEDPSSLSDEELMQRCFVNIVNIFTAEFDEEGDTKEHFRNIANTLLEDAFPQKTKDPHLPVALQQILQGKGFYAWALSFKVDTKALTWEALVNHFADSLEKIYESLKVPPVALVTEADSPGITAFIDTLTRDDQVMKLELTIPDFNTSSNALINQFIKQLITTDRADVQEARKLVLGRLKQNIHIICSILFDSEERLPLAEKLASFATSKLSQLEPTEKSTAAFLEEFLRKGFDVKKLEKLFPEFLTVDDAFTQISTLLAPLVLQLVQQSAAIKSNRAEDAIAPVLATGLAKLREVIEAKALAGTLEFTGFAFLDECICHLLKPSKNKAAKDYVDSLLQSIASLLLREKKQGNETADETLGRIVNQVLDEGRQAVLQGGDLKAAARKILSNVITEEQFAKILPEFLKQGKLWDAVADLLAEYLKGMNVQAQKSTRELQVPALRVLLQDGMDKILLLVKSEAENQSSSFDKVKGKILQGKALQELLQKVLPSLLESILAYHVNPQKGKAAEKRTAELFFTILQIANAGFERIEGAGETEEWLLQNGYTKEMLVAYRKAHDIPQKEQIVVKNFLLHEVTHELIAKLLPDELLKEIIPQEFAPFHLEQLLGNLIFDYVVQAQEFAHVVNSFSATTMQLRPDLDVSQIQTLLGGAQSKEEAFWLQAVFKEIFSTQDETKKALLEKLSSNVLIGALGMILAKSEGPSVEKDLVAILAPIAKEAQQAFLLLNAKKSAQEIGISKQEIARYQEIIGKKRYDLKQLTYWVLARRGLDQLLDDAEWQKLVPEFLRPLLSKDVVANLLSPIYERIHEVQAPLQREAEKGSKKVAAEEGLNAYIDDTVIKAISELLFDLGSKDAPLGKTIPPLLDKLIKQIFVAKGDIGNVRTILVERAVYAVFEALLRDKSLLTEKLVTLFKTFKEGNHAATAKMLLSALLPKELSELPLSKVLIEEVLLPELTEDFGQLEATLARIEEKGTLAASYLAKLEGVGPLVTTMLQSLDETIDELSKNPDRLTKALPQLLDSQLKEILGNKELAPTIKRVIHSVVQISLQEALTPKEKAVEVIAKVIELYNKPSSQETAREWLQLLLPEKILQEILPEFLRPAFTHDNLAKWFFVPYVEEIKETHKQVANMQGPVNETARMQKFVRTFLADVATSKSGISGFGGVVRDLEQNILSSFGNVVDPYIEGVVGQVLNALKDSGRLHEDFLSTGLMHALSSKEKVPDDFGKKAADKLLSIIFPNGAESLLVPEVAKKAVWAKIEQSLEQVFTEMTVTPLEWTTKRLISLSTDDPRARDKLLEDIKTKEPEKLFKECLVSAVVHQADEQMKKSTLWAPFKWIARQFVKVVAYFVARFSLQDRAYQFLTAPDCGEKIARIIWAFLQYERPIGESVKADDLAEKLAETFESNALLPNALINAVSSNAAKFLVGKNIVDLVS